MAGAGLSAEFFRRRADGFCAARFRLFFDFGAGAFRDLRDPAFAAAPILRIISVLL
jgi:hypothetical protein